MSEEPDDLDEEVIATISDYLDGALPGPRRVVVAAKTAAEPIWQRAHDELVENRKFMSGLQKARPKPTFAHEVTSTIHERSAGRFFGRRTFGDRVPFGGLLIVALLALAVVGYVLWSSQTGSLKVHHEPHSTTHGSGADIAPAP